MSKIDIKNKLDNSIFRAYNFISNFQFRINFLSNKKLIAKNIILKDRHKDERCFILGTGPSLKNVDLELLKDEIVFGVNYLYSKDTDHVINPSYYSFYDEYFYNNDSEKMIEIINSLPETKFFVRTQAYKELNSSNVNDSQIHYQHCNLYPLEDYVKCDMTSNMTVPFNVITGCIQSAIYMGFSQIYLLGSDFNSFATLKEEHYYDEEESPERSISLGLELQFYSTVAYQHYYINKYSNEIGVKIYNMTENSLLDAYERIPLDLVLKKNEDKVNL